LYLAPQHFFVVFNKNYDSGWGLISMCMNALRNIFNPMWVLTLVALQNDGYDKNQATLIYVALWSELGI
jgi:hypothetical protein